MSLKEGGRGGLNQNPILSAENRETRPSWHEHIVQHNTPLPHFGGPGGEGGGALPEQPMVQSSGQMQHLAMPGEEAQWSAEPLTRQAEAWPPQKLPQSGCGLTQVRVLRSHVVQGFPPPPKRQSTSLRQPAPHTGTHSPRRVSHRAHGL